MNLETAKKYILLEQSGELSPRKQAKLAAFLLKSEEARIYRKESAQWVKAARAAGMPAVCDIAVTRILEAARRIRPEERAPEFARPAWRPALAWAAVLLLLLAGGLVLFRIPAVIETATPSTPMPEATTTSWDDSMDEDIAELGALLASAAENGSATSEADIDAMAADLLDLEGLNI